MLNIDSLENGIVIDHITAGNSMKIYELLELANLDCCVAVIKNARSTKYGKKDIIKIDGVLDVNLDILGFVDSNITVCYIKDGVLVKKEKMVLPKKLKNVIKCKNPRCITSVEQELPQRFKLTDPENGVYRCIYCEAKAEIH